MAKTEILQIKVFSDYYPQTDTYIPVLHIWKQRNDRFKTIYLVVFDRIHGVRKFERSHNVAVDFKCPSDCINLPNMVDKMYKLYKSRNK